MSNHGQNLYVKCVDEAVIIFGKGVFREYLDALHWSIRAMFGDADAPTMGLDGLAIFLALWGLFITSYLIGERQARQAAAGLREVLERGRRDGARRAVVGGRRGTNGTAVGVDYVDGALPEREDDVILDRIVCGRDPETLRCNREVHAFVRDLSVAATRRAYMTGETLVHQGISWNDELFILVEAGPSSSTRRATRSRQELVAPRTPSSAHLKRCGWPWEGPVLEGVDVAATYDAAVLARARHRPLGAPVRGSANYSATVDGFTYLFASTESRDAFAAAPGDYELGAGGFSVGVGGARASACAASADTDDLAADGKLYFFRDAARHAFFDDEAVAIAGAAKAVAAAENATGAPCRNTASFRCGGGAAAGTAAEPTDPPTDPPGAAPASLAPVAPTAAPAAAATGCCASCGAAAAATAAPAGADGPIGATLNLIAGERPPRRAPELLDLLLLRALDKNETSAAALEDEIADVGDARAVRWAWRHASSAYGYAQLKVLGLLPGVFPRSLGDASPERLDAACVRARCGGAELYHGAFKSNMAADVAAPGFYVAYDDERKKVVVSVRGTASAGDALTDLVCEATPCRGGSAHAGILGAAEAVFAGAEPAVLAALGDHGDANGLVFTGHSMGGGAALLCGLLLRDGRDGPGVRLAAALRDRGLGVDVVAFAPPPVATADAAAARPGDVAVRCRSYCVGDDVRASKAAAASLLDAVGLFPAPRPRPRATRSAEEDIHATLRPVLAAARRGFDPPATAPALVVPGGVLRVARSGLAAMDPDRPLLRLADAACSTTPTAMDAVLDQLVAQADLVDGGDAPPAKRPRF
ncbi:voltage-gated potassium channel [Aureococcus anophagefferens]|nr:voltage-gated potassium channel [Aureococcus anophagefferens]